MRSFERRMAADGGFRIRRGLLSVTVLNFEDLTGDGVFGGAACDPPPRLQASLISPELQRWTERGTVPKTIGPGSEAVLQGEGATIQQFQIVVGVACVGCPLLHIECFSSPPAAAADDAAEEDADADAGEPPRPHEAHMCTELLSTEEVPDPQVHLWEQRRLKEDLQRLIEEKRAQLEEDPKDKALEGELRQLEVDMDVPVPPPPALEKNVTLLFDDGREAARISVSLALALDPETAAPDDSMQSEEATDAPQRTQQCPRPVEEAFAAATSVLDAVISRAVDNWLDFVFQRRARQYAAAYCLEAASAVLELGELQPVGEPEALAQRAHRRGAAPSQDGRPRSARVSGGTAGAAGRPPAHPRSVPLAPSVPLGGRPSPWASPRFPSPRLPPDPFASDGHGEAAAAPPYWGYVSEEAVPAPIDNMARGVVPIRVRPTGDMTDSMLLLPEGMIPSAGIGTGKNAKKAPSATSRSSSKAAQPYVTTHDRKAAEALASLTGANRVGVGSTAAGRLRPASAPVIRASALAGGAAGTRVGGERGVVGVSAAAGSAGAGLATDGIKEALDNDVQESLRTYRSAQGAAAARPPAAKRRPASAAARSSAVAPLLPEAGNVLESQV